MFFHPTKPAFLLKITCFMKRTIEFFLFPDAVGLDIVGPLEVFSSASQLLMERGQKSKIYQFCFSAEEVGKIKLSSGLELHADKKIGTSMPSSVFLVPGGMGVDKVVQNSGLLKKIKAVAERSRLVVSVCGGAFILAACGLLNDKQATTHWQSTKQLADKYPDINVIPDAIYVRDGKIATSAGVTAGIDLALALVEEDFDSTLAMEVAKLLVLYLRRPGFQTQFSVPLELNVRTSNRFSDLHHWASKRMHLPLTVDTLANQVGMSPRNFSRVFTTDTGISPGKYIESLRVEFARELLESGKESIEEIARLSGFQRDERLRRAFLRRFGITPTQYRFHFNKKINGN